MTRKLLLSTTLVLVAGTAWAQDKARALVCPPSLDYCYYLEKPIRSKPTIEENSRAARKVSECLQKEVAMSKALGNVPVEYNCHQYFLPERLK